MIIFFCLIISFVPVLSSFLYPFYSKQNRFFENFQKCQIYVLSKGAEIFQNGLLPLLIKYSGMPTKACGSGVSSLTAAKVARKLSLYGSFHDTYAFFKTHPPSNFLLQSKQKSLPLLGWKYLPLQQLQMFQDLSSYLFEIIIRCPTRPESSTVFPPGLNKMSSDAQSLEEIGRAAQAPLLNGKRAEGGKNKQSHRQTHTNTHGRLSGAKQWQHVHIHTPKDVIKIIQGISAIKSCFGLIAGLASLGPARAFLNRICASPIAAALQGSAVFIFPTRERSSWSHARATTDEAFHLNFYFCISPKKKKKMEERISKPECKNMDACLRRLKQELVRPVVSAALLLLQSSLRWFLLYYCIILCIECVLANTMFKRALNSSMCFCYGSSLVLQFLAPVRGVLEFFNSN